MYCTKDSIIMFIQNEYWGCGMVWFSFLYITLTFTAFDLSVRAKSGS